MLFVSPHIRRLIDLALDEDDLGFDATSAAFFAGESASAYLLAKQDLVVSGLEVARAAYARVDPGVEWSPLVADGARVSRGEVIGRVAGPAISVLRGERVALNFLQRMCGVATKTAEYVEALGNERVRLVDTRKTLPGWRELDKYAVRCGGGHNHRYTLSGGVMVKDNHIAAAGSVREAVRRVREVMPHTLRVEVEVTTIGEVDDALAAGAEIIMLDNMATPMMREAIARIRAVPRDVVIEVSGNVTIERLGELGALDVDVVSTGAITHSVPASDISMKFD
jgi:nicotinate-nucleotide pyrophosphorylase (carboxylating)